MACKTALDYPEEGRRKGQAEASSACNRKSSHRVVAQRLQVHIRVV